MEIDAPVVTARGAGLVACRSCAHVSRMGESVRCPHCAGPLNSRRPQSLQRVWAWLLAGILTYIPAHMFPLMVRSQLGDVEGDTILSGFWYLIDNHSYLIAIVVFMASVAIPMSKFAIIAALALSISQSWSLSPLRRQHAFEVIELIGRWSMIDVFVVTVLAGLVQLGTLARVEPGLGATFFGLSVICTMVSALSFDSRLLWDQAPGGR